MRARAPPPEAEVKPRRSLLIAPESVHLKTRVGSLPDLHKGFNYSRSGAALSRVEALQRQFEHTGIYPPLTRRKRFGQREPADSDTSPVEDRAGGRRARLAQAPLSGAGGATVDPADDAPVESASPIAPIVQDKYGSIVNVLELRVAEAHGHRQAAGKLPAGEVLEVASRRASDACLLALRQLAAAVAPVYGGVLARIADVLEPCLLSPDYLDGEGRRMTYEQVVKLVLSPRLGDEEDRALAAEVACERATRKAEQELQRCVRLKRDLDAHTPTIRGLEGKQTLLEVEANNAKREAKALAADNEILTARAEQASQSLERIEELTNEVKRLQDQELQLKKHTLDLALQVWGAPLCCACPTTLRPRLPSSQPIDSCVTPSTLRRSSSGLCRSLSSLRPTPLLMAQRRISAQRRPAGCARLSAGCMRARRWRSSSAS